MKIRLLDTYGYGGHDEDIGGVFPAVKSGNSFKVTLPSPANRSETYELWFKENSVEVLDSGNQEYIDELLKKETPMYPLGDKYQRCPNCDKEDLGVISVRAGVNLSRCPVCGQSINWEVPPVELGLTKQQWFDEINKIKDAVIRHVDFMYNGEGASIEEIIDEIENSEFNWVPSLNVSFKDE